MEIKLSEDGMIAHRETKGSTDITGEPRDWVIDFIPLGRECDVWVGFPLYNYEVDGWTDLPDHEPLVNFIEAVR